MTSIEFIPSDDYSFHEDRHGIRIGYPANATASELIERINEMAGYEVLKKVRA